ncbi:ribosomal protein L7/L12 [Candidatus Vidania fulgoroideorum]
MKKVEDIFKDICSLNIIDLGRLIEMAEEKFGKLNMKIDENNFDEKKKESIDNRKKSITLNKCGPNRIPVIKLLKEITNKSLIESKKIIDELPKLIIDDIENDLFLDYKKKFEDLGCVIE